MFPYICRDYELEGVKVMHTTEFLIENGFDMEMKADNDLTVTYHDLVDWEGKWVSMKNQENLSQEFKV